MLECSYERTSGIFNAMTVGPLAERMNFDCSSRIFLNLHCTWIAGVTTALDRLLGADDTINGKGIIVFFIELL